MHVVHVDLGRRGRGVVPVGSENHTWKRVASLLARDERYRHHLQSAMDPGTMNALKLKGLVVYYLYPKRPIFVQVTVCVTGTNKWPADE